MFDQHSSFLRTSILFGLSFLLPIIVYLSTCAPDVSFTDSGELAGVAASFGVAHPTGYPLYSIVTSIWAKIPLSPSIVARLNIFAAVCTALSSAMMFLLLQSFVNYIASAASSSRVNSRIHQNSEDEISGNKKRQHKKHQTSQNNQRVKFVRQAWSMSVMVIDFAAFFSALAYSFAYTVWQQANTNEVYSFQIFMITTVLWLSVQGFTHKNNRFIFLGSLALGLAFANHLTSILLLLPTILLFFYRPGEPLIFDRERRRNFLICLALVLSCSLLYGVLWLRSSAEPVFNWGAVHRGYDEFLYHVLGKQFRVWMFDGSSARQFKTFLQILPLQFSWIGLLPVALGFVVVWIRSRQLALWVTVLIAGCILYSINYGIHDIDSYFLTAFIGMFMCFVAGCVYSAERFGNQYIAYILSGGVAVASLSLNYKAVDQSKNTLVREYVQMMIDPLPQNSVLISQQWDYLCSAFWYMQKIEGYRPDVVLIEKELLRRTWYPTQLTRWYPDAIESCAPEISAYMVDLQKFENDEPFDTRAIQRNYVAMLNAFLTKNEQSRPLFVTQDVLNEEGFAQMYGKVPYGLAMHLTTPALSPRITPLDSLFVDEFAQSAKIARQKKNDAHLETGIITLVSQSLTNAAAYSLVTNNLEHADSLFARALRVDPSNPKALQGREKIRSMRLAE